MCGRYAVSASTEQIGELFAVDEVAGPLPPPDYNVAPTDLVPAVLERRRAEGRRRLLVGLRWGLVPSWAKDPDSGPRLINARMETVAEKPAFRKAFAARRCLLPATGYYEWRPVAGPGGRPAKQPYFLRPADGSLLAMAGIYEYWKAPDGDWLATASVITTAATDAAGQIHDRMPLTVPPANWSAWLDPEFGADARVLLAVPAPGLRVHPVSTAVNKVTNDGPELIEPLE